VRYRLALADGQRVTATNADRSVRQSLSVGAPAWAGWFLADQRLIEE
jgi:hypothetical protein